MGQVALDARVLSVTLGLTLLTAILFGLVPAIQATRLDVQAALAEGGTRSVAGGAKGWPRRLLVVAEVALGVVLLVGAGLLIRTFMYLQTLPAGFDPTNVVAVSASLEDARYEKHENVEPMFARSLERLRAMPGVESAAMSLGLPYERILNMGARIVERPGAERFHVLDRDLRDARILRDAAPADAWRAARSATATPRRRRRSWS